MAREMEYTGTLHPGETLVLRAYEQLATVDGVNAMKDITGDWIYLDPGDNEVDYEDDSVARTAGVLIEWRAMWL